MRNEISLSFFTFIIIQVYINASHLNSLLMTSSVINYNSTNVQVELTVFASWRRSWSSGSQTAFCNETVMKSHGLIGQNINIYCIKGCTNGAVGQLLLSPIVECTAYSTLNDWSQGEIKIILDLAPNNTDFEISSIGGNWRSLDDWNRQTVTCTAPCSGLTWQQTLKIDLTLRPGHDNNNIMNSSPLTIIPPVLQLRAGEKYVLNIPTYDADGDITRCRWASSNKSECAGICQSVPFAIIDPVNCTMTFDLTNSSVNYANTWWGAALQVEDYYDTSNYISNPESPYSSVPAQFLIHVDVSSDTCKKSPSISGGGCVSIKANSSFSSRIIAKSNCPNVIIKEIQIMGPFGLTYTQVLPLPGGTNQYYADMTWSPDSTQTGGNIICNIATDSNKMSSALSCFSVLVGGVAPSLVNSTAKPSGILSSSYLLGINGYLNYQISFDEAVKRPISDAYIHISLKNGTELFKMNANNSTQVSFSGSTIGFKFPIYSFAPGSYYVTFDLGVGLGNRTKPWYCDPNSPEILDTSFWNFIVPLSPLTLTAVLTTNNCIPVDEIIMNRFFATVGYPGASYISNILITVPNIIGYSPIIQNTSNFTSFKDVYWNSSDNGPYLINATAIDNLNQQQTISFNLTACCSKDPDLKKSSGNPSNTLTSSFLLGSNGFMTFSVSFNSSVFRPKILTYIRIYNLNGTVSYKLDCSSSGFVFYIKNSMYFQIPVNTFPPDTYYIFFDEGTGNINSTCQSKSTAVSDSFFWRFTVPAKFTNQTNSKSPLISNYCASSNLNNYSDKKCNISSFIFLQFLFFLIGILVHILAIIFLVTKCCIARKRNNSVEKHPYYFTLFVPHTYKYSTNSKHSSAKIENIEK